MKYYTPELLARFGSEDLGAAKTARQELERKADEYVSHLGLIRPKLPPRFAELQERYYLHDARVVGPIFPWLHPDHMLRFPVMPWWDFALDVQAGDAGPGRFSSLALMLQLDAPPQEFLVLHYRSVLIDEVSHHPRLQEDRNAPLEWLHDEVDLLQSGGLVEVEHSVLFTHGLELRLRFQDFDYAALSPMALPAGKKEARPAKR